MCGGVCLCAPCREVITSHDKCVCLSVCLSTYLCPCTVLYFTIDLYALRAAYPSIYLCTYQSIYLRIYLSIYPRPCLSIDPSTGRLPVYLSMYVHVTVSNRVHIPLSLPLPLPCARLSVAGAAAGLQNRG